jgi:hypothetical protein
MAFFSVILHFAAKGLSVDGFAVSVDPCQMLNNPFGMFFSGL